MCSSTLAIRVALLLVLHATCGRETEEGCACDRTWHHQSYPPCLDYCCNPDDDPRGEWCMTKLEVRNVLCWFQPWGYCKRSSPTPAPAPTAKDEFEQFEQGACRGVTPDHSPSSWFRATAITEPEECFQTCLDDTNCYAVELYIEHRQPWTPVQDNYCEHWNREPLSSGANLVYDNGVLGGGNLKACFKKKSAISQSLLFVSAPRAYTAHLNQICPRVNMETDSFPLDPNICRELCTEERKCTAFSVKETTDLWSWICVFAQECSKADLQPASEVGWLTFTKGGENIAVPTDSLELAEKGNFTRFQDGPCRGFQPDHNPESWYAVLPSADPQTCFQTCLDDVACKAVEVFVTWDGKPSGFHCELWSHEPNTTGLEVPHDNYTRACFKKAYMPSGARPDFEPLSKMYSSHPNMLCNSKDDLGVYVKSLEECNEACTENQDCLSYAFKSWNWCELSRLCNKAQLKPTTMVGWTTYVKASDSSELAQVEVSFPAFADYEQFQSGACRGDRFDHNPEDWYTKEDNTRPEECFESCNNNPACMAVEIVTNILGFPVGTHCEIWSHMPTSTALGGSNAEVLTHADHEYLYPGNKYRTCFKRKNASESDRPVLDTSTQLFLAHPKMSCEGKGDLGVSYTYSEYVCRELCIENSKCISYTYVLQSRGSKCLMSSTCTEGLLTSSQESATTFVKASHSTVMTSKAKTLWQKNFSQFQDGPCRGYSPQHNPASWYRSASLADPETCLSICQADPQCKAVEMYTRQTDGELVGGQCEIWFREPRATGATFRYSLNRVLSCFKVNEVRDAAKVEGSTWDPDWQPYMKYSKRWCPGRNELATYDHYSFDMCQFLCTESESCVAFEWFESAKTQQCQLSTSCVESLLVDVSSDANWTTYVKNAEPTTATVTMMTTTARATMTTTTTTVTTETATAVTTTRTVLTTTTTTAAETTTTTTTTLEDSLLQTFMTNAQVQKSEGIISIENSTSDRTPFGAPREGGSSAVVTLALSAGIGVLLLVICGLSALYVRSRMQLKAARNEATAAALNPNYDLTQLPSNASDGAAVVIGSPVTAYGGGKAEDVDGQKPVNGVAAMQAGHASSAAASSGAHFGYTEDTEWRGDNEWKQEWTENYEGEISHEDQTATREWRQDDVADV